jgi:hypothetical protein
MFRVVFGFVVGVVIARNAAPMGSPQWAAALAAFGMGCYLTYRFGSKDKASAVAVAMAEAHAQAEAQAQAIAQAAVHLHLTSLSAGGGEAPAADPAIPASGRSTVDTIGAPAITAPVITPPAQTTRL